MARRKLRMLDLFAGLGGASAAMRARGWDVVTVDADPAFCCTHTADLTSWSYSGPPVDLVWASPPCTEFSRDFLPWLRGKYPPPSLDLACAAVRIIREVGPIWWVIENVRGAVQYLTPLLGRRATQVGQAFLWGDFPSLGKVRVQPHKERLSSRRRAERSAIPYPISLATAEACESGFYFLHGVCDMAEDWIELLRALRAAQLRFGESREMAAEARRLEAIADEAIRKGEIPSGHGFKQGSLFSASSAGPYGGGS